MQKVAISNPPRPRYLTARPQQTEDPLNIRSAPLTFSEAARCCNLLVIILISSRLNSPRRRHIAYIIAPSMDRRISRIAQDIRILQAPLNRRFTDRGPRQKTARRSLLYRQQLWNRGDPRSYNRRSGPISASGEVTPHVAVVKSDLLPGNSDGAFLSSFSSYGGPARHITTRRN